MANRKKIYYADNEIKEGLFTNGSEWMILDTWENYRGFYHIYESTNEVFTEQSWHPTKSRVLVPYKNKSESYFRYVDIVNYGVFNGQKRELSGPTKYYRFVSPIATIRQPSAKEKSRGIMTRYFVFKRNELESRLPIEIDKKQADTYPTQNNGINQYLYELIELPWKIDGPEFDVIQDGILKISGVYNTNKRIVEKYSKKFPILKKVLTNFREFSIYNVNNA
jgi:hypothetical protein